jgi:diguanylate cyclase (GGDEF)-like protein
MKKSPAATALRGAMRRLRRVSLVLGLLTALVLFAAQQFYYELQDARQDALSNARALLEVAHVAREQRPNDTQALLSQATERFDRVLSAHYCSAGRCFTGGDPGAATCKVGGWDRQALCVEVRSSQGVPESVTVRYRLVQDHLATARDIAFFALILAIAVWVAHVGSSKLRARADAAERELRHAASHDALTGLLSRLGLEAQVDSRIHEPGVLLVLDLDGFKEINDRLGRHAGDSVLLETAARIAAASGPRDAVGRLDADEFGVFLAGSHRQDADRHAGDLIRRLSAPIMVDAQALVVGVRLGAAELGEGVDSFEEALRRADLALFKAKRRGRTGPLYFDAGMDDAMLRRYELQDELKRGIGLDQLVLHYQPQVDALGRLSGVEALARWRHPDRGLLAPDQFIPIAEESGLIVPLGLKVMEMACADLVTAREAGVRLPYVSVNVSPLQLSDPGLESTLLATIGRHGLGPRDIEIELTESSLMDLEGADDSIVHRLAKRGFRIAIDDFGTGHSSLSRLHDLPVDKLKIDRAFVRHLSDTARGTVIAESIIGLAQRMRLKTVAEGVETQDQADWLSNAGCTLMQGFLFARPMPLSELLQWTDSQGDVRGHDVPTWEETSPLAEA